MATKGRKGSSYVASLLWLAGIFLLLWGPRPVSADGSAMDEAKETTESWANWVQDKVTEGLGLRHENARMAAEQIKDTAGHAAGKISSTASDTAKHATHTAEEIKDAVTKTHDDKNPNVRSNSKGVGSAYVDDSTMNQILMERAAKTCGKSSPSLDEQKLMAILKSESPIPNEKLMAMLKASPLTEEKFMAILKEEPLKSNSEGAKEKAKKTYETAKDTMTESAKANYEAAKEKASQATGHTGATTQQKTAGEL